MIKTSLVPPSPPSPSSWEVGIKSTSDRPQSLCLVFLPQPSLLPASRPPLTPTLSLLPLRLAFFPPHACWPSSTPTTDKTDLKPQFSSSVEIILTRLIVLLSQPHQHISTAMGPGSPRPWKNLGCQILVFTLFLRASIIFSLQLLFFLLAVCFYLNLAKSYPLS